MIEIILEDKIAALQKAQKKLRYLKSHPQEELETPYIDALKEIEVSQQYTFKEQVCLNNQVKIPIIENFFENNVVTENFAIWQKQRNLVVSLAIEEEIESVPEIKYKAYEIEEPFKKNMLYVDFTRIEEIKNEEYLYQYININIPTSIGTLIQDTLIVYHNNKALTIVMFYSKDLVNQLNNAIKYMMQHLIWEGENLCVK